MRDTQTWWFWWAIIKSFQLNEMPITQHGCQVTWWFSSCFKRLFLVYPYPCMTVGHLTILLACTPILLAYPHFLLVVSFVGQRHWTNCVEKSSAPGVTQNLQLKIPMLTGQIISTISNYREIIVSFLFFLNCEVSFLEGITCFGGCITPLRKWVRTFFSYAYRIVTLYVICPHITNIYLVYNPHKPYNPYNPYLYIYI